MTSETDDGSGTDDTLVPVYFAGGDSDGTFDRISAADAAADDLTIGRSRYLPTGREVLSSEGTWQIWAVDHGPVAR